MRFPEFHYSWARHLASHPTVLWPHVSYTDHFNCEMAVPAVVKYLSSVNAAVPVEPVSYDGDIVVSEAVRNDTEVIATLDHWGESLPFDAEERPLNGSQSSFRIWRLNATAGSDVTASVQSSLA
jgi:hypothetical protein